MFFFAEWHEPSKRGGQMSLVFQTLAQRYSEKLKFLTLEAEKIPKISEMLEVSVVPTFLGIRNGSIVWKLEGANPPELGKLVKKFADNSNDFTPISQLPIPPPSLEDRLRSLVSSAPVMLFMKGVPDAARCGFSRKTVEILRKNDVPFYFFDILQDDEVRNGLKKLYDWPTFPQLYVNGQLVGGYDILLEMSSTDDGGITLKKELGIEHLSAGIMNNTAPTNIPTTTRGENNINTTSSTNTCSGESQTQSGCNSESDPAVLPDPVSPPTAPAADVV